MNKFAIYLSTILKLGIYNVSYMIWYRTSIKAGLRKMFFRQRNFSTPTPFFKTIIPRQDFPSEWKKKLIADADRVVSGEIRYYGYHWKFIGNPPNWFLNPFNGQEYNVKNIHWSTISDFNASIGDIKNVWEASRFEWVVTLSRAYAVTGKGIYIDTLNNWLSDWTMKNPLNTGPNWKCGQEASIRLFNLMNAAYILNQYDNPTKSLTDFVYHSLKRINNNIRYAIAQDNNHGTSEATGLFIGAEWLNRLELKEYKNIERYAKNGRYWLENRVNKLIAPAGNFSQHSVTYHRVLLDTLIFAELWRRILRRTTFSPRFYLKSKSAVKWLYNLTDNISGDAPNLGANDGAILLNTHSCSYRNFIPTLQLAAKIFYNSIWYHHAEYNEVLYWFNLNDSENTNPPVKDTFSANGFAVINGSNTWSMIRWPWFRFRPSHNDVMHFDLWYNGQNILCDSGTYSYNPNEKDELDLTSVHVHNSVSFDHQEQMPKISRFLLGKWIEPGNIELIINGNSEKWSGTYKDNNGNQHHRIIYSTENRWVVSDTIHGTFRRAVIGYNINTNECILESGRIITPLFQIELPVKTKAVLKKVIVSEHYMELHDINRLEIEIDKPGTYSTSFIFN